jgi:hypothetical protein
MSSAAYNLVSKCPLKERLLVSTKNYEKYGDLGGPF